MQCLGTDTGFPGPCWGREEQTESMNVPQMTGIEVSHNFGIPVSEGNPILCVQASDHSNMPFVVDG